MATSGGNLFLRNDTIFGVCQGLGEDLGISPNLLRVPLATGIMFAPEWVLGIYAALGLVVLASRLLFPDQRVVGASVKSAPDAVPAPANEAGAAAERVLEAA